MKEVFNILSQLEGTRSRNSKKYILSQNCDNELLKKYFLYAFNDRWVFGIGQKSIKKYGTVRVVPNSNISQKSLFGNTVSEYLNVFDLLDELMKHPYGSSGDVTAVNQFLARCTEAEYYWYTRLILKDLKIGCTVKTVNEVYNNYIPVFEVQLAHSYKDYLAKFRLGIPFQLQEKINGFRLIVYHHADNSVQFFTRNGLELFDFPELVEAFNNYDSPYPYTMVYDGEAQKDLSFNETQKYMMRHGSKVGIVYNLFDCVPLHEWESHDFTENLFDRYAKLPEFLKDTLGTIIVLKVRELYHGLNLDQINYWFDYAKTQKWEGIMVKFNLPYIRDRDWRMLKLKEMQDIDLTCIRVNRGESGGRFETTLGSVTVDYKGVEVNVGGGFSDKDRNYYWDNPDAIVGKTVSVQYFMETENEAGKPSLQFPQFLGVRQDK